MFPLIDATLRGRVVGDIDGQLQAVKVNANSLKLDDKGVQLTPEHLHMAIRQALGISDHPLAKQYALTGDPVKLG